MLNKVYYLVGIKNKETNDVEIYNGGTRSDLKFCKLGNGLGKAYISLKSAQNRINSLIEDYHKIYKEEYFKKIDFIIYKLEATIFEFENEICHSDDKMSCKT